MNELEEIIKAHRNHGASPDGFSCASRRSPGRCLPYKLARRARDDEDKLRTIDMRMTSLRDSDSPEYLGRLLHAIISTEGPVASNPAISWRYMHELICEVGSMIGDGGTMEVAGWKVTTERL